MSETKMGPELAREPKHGLYDLQMCPRRERRMRVENELVHDLEIPIEFKGRRVIDIPQEKLRLVKKFQRSAAGQKMDAKDDIRSPKVCFQTTLYLMHFFQDPSSLSISEKKSRYHFINDRLRAARQDLVIHGCHDHQARAVLYASVRFHLLSHVLLSANKTDFEFDPELNFKFLLESLKAVLVLDDDLDTDPDIDQRMEMIVVYLILNLGHPSAIDYVIKLPKDVKANINVQRALQMSFCMWTRNFVRIMKLMKKLPEVGQVAFEWIKSTVIVEGLKSYSYGFSSKVLTFPIPDFAKLIDLTPEEVKSLLETLKVPVKGEEIIFSKGSLDLSSKFDLAPKVDYSNKQNFGMTFLVHPLMNFKSISEEPRQK